MSELRLSRRHLVRSVFASGALVGVGLLSACGGDSKKSVTIKMTEEMVYEPATVTIKVGETVTWKNDSAFVHTATADPDLARQEDLVSLPAGAEPWDSGNVEQGKSWSHTFTVPGEYRYFCLPHYMVGMTGMVIVEE
jgi:plastocyanin